MAKKARSNKLNKMWNPATMCLGIVLLAACVLTAPHIWALLSLQGTAQAKKECKPFERGRGVLRASRGLAELSAISQWSGKAQLYGASFSNWSNAERKRILCSKIKGSPSFNCSARARPCRNLYQQASVSKKTNSKAGKDTVSEDRNRYVNIKKGKQYAFIPPRK